MSLQTDPNEAASLHLVIRPDAWSEPPARGHHGPRKAPGSPDAGKAPGRSPFSSNATFLDPLESTPYFGPPPPAPSTTFAPSSSNRDATSERSTPEQRLAALFETLEPSQGPTLKALFLTAQEFYLHLYEVTWHELYGPTVADTRPSTSNMSEQDAAEMEQSVKMLSEDVLGLPSLLSINDLPPIQRDTTLPTSSYIHQQTTIQ